MWSINVCASAAGRPATRGQNSSSQRAYCSAVVGANATTKIDRTQWGLMWNRAIEAGGVTVSNEVKITLGIEANKPNPNAPPPPPRPGQ